jgi:hypothetical protein
VTYIERDGFAELVGFDHRKFSLAEYRAVILSINHSTGKLVAYDRAGPPPLRIVQQPPSQTKGKIVMLHKRPKNVAHAINVDTGEVDERKVADELENSVIPLLRSGRLKLRNPTETKLDDGWDRLSFERQIVKSPGDDDQ